MHQIGGFGSFQWPLGGRAPKDQQVLPKHDIHRLPPMSYGKRRPGLLMWISPNDTNEPLKTNGILRYHRIGEP